MKNLLGLPDLKVNNVYNDQDDEKLIVECQVDQPKPPCPDCSSRNLHVHDSNIREIKDLSMHDKLVCLKITVIRYLCMDCGVTFYEQVPCAPERGNMTTRLRDHIKERCLNDTYSRVARDFNLSANTIRRIFAEYVEANKEKLVYTAPKVLGIDEAHLNDIMRCVITDTENNLLLDILPDRETASVVKFLESMQDNQNIKVVTMDMWPAYRNAVYKSLPSAKVVVDRFHVVQLAVRCMDTVRKSFMDGLDKSDRSKLRYISSLMKMNYEALSDESKNKLNDWFCQYPPLGQAYLLKERIRTMYYHKSREEAGEAFQKWCDSVVDHKCDQFMSAMNTYNEWAREIFNYFDYRYTNAFTESANNLIKQIDKAGRSLSFDQLRYKVLFSTKATKEAKYSMLNADGVKYFLSEKYGYFGPQQPGHKQWPGKLVHGFGVDISKLLDELSHAFFSNAP